MNKIDLTRMIARTRLGDLVVDGIVATCPAANSIIDQRIAAEVDNQLKGFQLYVYQGKGANQDKVVSANNTLTMSLTIAPSFSTVPTVGDLYFLFRRFGWPDYSAAIDSAMLRAMQLNLIPYSATLGLVGTQYEYSVPSGFSYIHELQLVPSGSTDYELENATPLDRRAWSISKNPLGTYTVYLDVRFFDPEWNDDDMLIIRGQRIPGTLSAPTTNAEVDAEFLVTYASKLLAGRMVDEGQAWLQRYVAIKSEADRLESFIMRYPRASAVELI